MPFLKLYWSDSLNQKRSVSFGQKLLQNSDWSENAKSAVGELEMGEHARKLKITGMDTPAPLRRGKERAADRRGILDDPGTGWSLLVSSLRA